MTDQITFIREDEEEPVIRLELSSELGDWAPEENYILRHNGQLEHEELDGPLFLEILRREDDDLRDRTAWCLLWDSTWEHLEGNLEGPVPYLRKARFESNLEALREDVSRTLGRDPSHAQASPTELLGLAMCLLLRLYVDWMREGYSHYFEPDEDRLTPGKILPTPLSDERPYDTLEEFGQEEVASWQHSHEPHHPWGIEPRSYMAEYQDELLDLFAETMAIEYDASVGEISTVFISPLAAVAVSAWNALTELELPSNIEWESEAV